MRDANIVLKKGEVLGLLGGNGAGKTTTFRMMCGIEVPDANENTEILTAGKSIFHERGACRRAIGYTAQDNPIWPRMTVREHLEFYARVKGVSNKDL